MVPEFDVFGFVRERTGNVMPGITPSNTHTTRDAKHVIVGANGDAIFMRLMHAIGRSDLAEDATLADNAGRDARAAELYAVIDEWVGRHDAEHVLTVLKAAGSRAPTFTRLRTCFPIRSISRGRCCCRHRCPTGLLLQRRNRAEAERDARARRLAGR